MIENRPYRALISGGGTGGHIFPALSIANALRRKYPDIEILFVGADNRMEMSRVPEAGYQIKGLPVSGFDRHNLLRNFKVLHRLYKSIGMARDIVKDFKPDIAIGVGGYCSGPTLWAAQNAKVPTVIQEQNSYAGVTNKILGKKAKAVCVAYEGMERFFPAECIHLTGNPVRNSLLECQLTPEAAKRAMGFDPSRPLILAVGGSLGARTINEAICAGLPKIAESGCQMLWQTGKYGADKYATAAAAYPDVHATTFVSDMSTAYRGADLVISRAGASTISELQLLGKPCILVPSPNVAEDHQRKNAEALAKVDAAVMILDSDAKDRLIATALTLINEQEKRRTLSENVAAMALRDSADKIVEIVSQILTNNQ